MGIFNASSLSILLFQLFDSNKAKISSVVLTCIALAYQAKFLNPIALIFFVQDDLYWLITPPRVQCLQLCAFVETPQWGVSTFRSINKIIA